MIAVTLTFKSIEAARAALLDIPADSLVGGTASTVPAPKVEEKAPVPEAPAAPPAEVAADPKPVVEPSEPEAPAAQPASSIEYAVLQKAVFTLAGKSKPAALDLAASMGVKTFKDLPADRWADALAAVNAKIAELG